MFSSGCVLTILVLYSCFDFAHLRKSGYKDNTDHHWDVLIFTQQWPTTSCEEWKEKSPSHKCTMPSVPNSFSIHGLWPTKYHTLGPFFCNRSAHFDPEAIKSIETELTDVWTNIEYGTSTYSLWAHEWTKHGTCAAEVLENFNTELKYFTRGLEFYRTYNLTNILSEADILPSVNKGYDVVDIVNAIRVHLGVNPVVECRKEKGKSTLFEIRICFTKELKIVDCDGVVHGTSGNVLTNCDRTQKILYLPYSTTSGLVQWYKLITWLQWFTL